jgi:hypothetical protein
MCTEDAMGCHCKWLYCTGSSGTAGLPNRRYSWEDEARTAGRPPAQSVADDRRFRRNEWRSADLRDARVRQRCDPDLRAVVGRTRDVGTRFAHAAAGVLHQPLAVSANERNAFVAQVADRPAGAAPGDVVTRVCPS